MTDLLSNPSLGIAISVIVLIATFIGIFTEEFHGLHRSKAALAGGAAMLLLGQIFGFYTSEDALHAIDWGVIFLLFCMMTYIAILAPTGGFQAIGYGLARISRGNPFYLMVLLGMTTAILSMLLDNVTTVVILGPLTIVICQLLHINPVPQLLAVSLASVLGGIGTIVGDPTSIMIGAASHASFLGYFTKMGPVVFLALITLFAALRLIFRKDLATAGTAMTASKENALKDPTTWYTGLAVLFGMVVLFLTHNLTHFEPWFIAGLGLATFMMLSQKTDVTKLFEDVEIALIMFFVSLFIVIGGVEASGALNLLAEALLPFVQQDVLIAAIALLWISAVLSGVIDNIPFVAAMLPILTALGAQGAHVEPLYWALAIGAGMGGLLTHVGSAVNLFIVSLSERIAKQTGDHSLAITPGLWIRRASPAIVACLLVATVFLILLFPHYSAPIW